jgi:hypothetical protein
MALRVVGPLLMVIAVRVVAGTGAAALAAVLVALGAWLQVRLPEATVGLAVFAGAVAVLGGANVRMLACFWLLGVGILLVRSGGASVWRHLFRRSALKAERTTGLPLRPES